MGIGGSKTQEIRTSKVAFIKETIANNPVVIFSKTYCSYCDLAKNIFDTLQQKYTTVELDQRNDAEEIQSILNEMTGVKTVPQVFVNGKCIGGGSDVKALHEAGKLIKILE